MKRPGDPTARRRAAEARLKARTATGPPQTEADLRRLQHELQVHQIELEMQNEELRTAHAETVAALENYTDLYDFAPVGYFSLKSDGTIRLANLTGARLVGVERGRLAGQQFGLLVAEDDRGLFGDFLARVFASETKQACQLTLRAEGRPTPSVRLEATRSTDGTKCHVAVIDITASTEAEAKLAMSERHLRAIFDTEPECVKLLADDGSLLEINPAGLRMLEADSFQQVENQCVYLLVAEEHRTAFRELTEKVFRGGSGSLEFEIVGLKGRRRWLETHATPLRNAAGKVISLLAITRDISRRRQLDAALRLSEGRFRAICETSPVGIFLNRPDGHVTYGNPSAVRMTGLAPENTMGLDWLQAVHPDDLVRLKADWKACQAEGRTYAGIGRFLHADGTVVWWDVLTAPILDGDSTVGFVGMITDATERRKADEELRASEERFSKAFRLSPDAIALWRVSDKRITDVNESFERISGFKREELIGRSGWESNLWVRKEDRDRYLTAVEGRSRLLSFEAEFRVKSGAHRLGLVSAELLEFGGEPHALSIIRDITESKRAEQELRFASRRLELIAQMTDAVIGSRAAADVAQGLAVRVQECFEVDACVIRILEDAQLALIGAQGIPPEQLQPHIPVFGIAQQILTTREPVIIPDVRTHPLTQSLARSSPGIFSFVAYAGVPLIAEDKIVGLLGIYKMREQHRFTAVDVEHLRIVANHIAVSLSNERLFNTVKDQKQQLEISMAERRRSEAALRESEAKFAGAFRASPLSLIISRVADGRILEVNENFTRMTGYSAEEARGRTSVEMGLWVDPEVRQRGLAELVERGFLRDWEATFKIKSGEIRIGSISVEMIQIGGEACTLSCSVDITERKQAEQRFAAFAALGWQLNAVTDAQAAARIIVGVADELFGWDSCKLDLYDAETDLCQPLLAMDILDDRRQEISAQNAFTPPSTRVRRMFHDGPLLILRENPQEGVQDFTPFGDLNRPSASIMLVPMRDGMKTIGVLSIQSYRLQAYTQADLRMLQNLADHCAGALARLRGRDALRESEEKFSAAFYNSPIPFLIGTLDGRIVEANQAFCDMMGYSRDEIIGNTTVGLGMLNAEAREKLNAAIASAGGTLRNIEMKLRAKDGGQRDVLFSMTTIRFHGDHHHLSVGTDMTDRKKAEETIIRTEQIYRRVIAAADAVTYEYDYQTGKYNFIGEGIERLTGYPPQDIGTALWRKIIQESVMLGEAAGLSNDEAMQKVMLGGIEHWRMDMRILTCDGQARWLSDVSVQKRDSAGHVTGSMGILQDITDRKLAEQRLRESREQLRSLLTRLQKAQEEERIRVAREIHDELGQLLTGLKMDVRWLERKLTRDDLPPALQPLLDRAVGASELADQTISVVQKIAAELRPGALDSLGLAAALTQRARRFQERTGIPCQVTVPESSLALPTETATELYYICQEALTNVMRHANATGVQIRFETITDGVVLEIRDDGRGFTEADLNRQQSLGLLGMRERAAHCGGTVLWERLEPHGTRLTVHVPLNPTPAKEGRPE